VIPRLKPALGWAELKAVVTSSGTDDIENFENSFADLAGQGHAIAFPYGRTAMVAILKALDLADVEIICPSYTCVVVPHAIVTSGNKPVFIDPDTHDFNMNLALIDDAITAKTRAIIATSLFGYPVNLDLLDEVQKRYPELILIQDCAHSFFCEWEGRPVHREGLCAFYGLNISKIMTSIFGGMVTTDNGDFANRLRQVRSEMLDNAGLAKSVKRLMYLCAVYVAFTRPVYGLVNRLERIGLLDRFVRYYDPGIIDMPDDYLLQMTPIEARVGVEQCLKYPTIVAHRRKLARIYLNGLAGLQGVQLPCWNRGSTCSHFVLRCEFAQRLKDYFLGKGIQLGSLVDYYIPEMESYRGSGRHGSGSARELPDEVVNLPVHMGTSEINARRIVHLVKAFIESDTFKEQS